MNMAFSPEGVNVYGLEALADWANKKYAAGLELEKLQRSSPRAIHDNLIELSKAHNNGKVTEMIDAKISQADKIQLLEWANERFDAISSDEVRYPPISSND